MDTKSKIYPRVSIIILNWNGLEDTIKCLESLKKITHTNYDHKEHYELSIGLFDGDILYDSSFKHG
jgi:hypothetical protein